MLACLLLAVLSTVVFAVSHNGGITASRRPVKVTYRSSYVLPNGEVKPGNTHVRTLAHGQMRRQEFREGKLFIDQYVDSEGRLYGVSHKRQELNPADLPGRFDLKSPPPTAEKLTAHLQFHRTEQILGRTVYVIQLRDDKGTLVSEMWLSPETHPLALKEVSFRDDGSQSVLEATSVEFDDAGEVRPAGYRVK
jgi:hypothetical protein